MLGFVMQENFESDYKELVMLVFKDFGTAIKTSLERTLPKYLTRLDGTGEDNGKHCVANQTEAMLEHAKHRRAMNNSRERPFGSGKQLRKAMPSLRHETVEGMVLSRHNRSFAREDSPRKTAKTADKPIRPAGFFHSQDPTVQMAIGKDAAVKQHARYRSEQDELRDRHDVHHDERRAAATEEFRNS